MAFGIRWVVGHPNIYKHMLVVGYWTWVLFLSQSRWDVANVLYFDNNTLTFGFLLMRPVW